MDAVLLIEAPRHHERVKKKMPICRTKKRCGSPKSVESSSEGAPQSLCGHAPLVVKLSCHCVSANIKYDLVDGVASTSNLMVSWYSVFTKICIAPRRYKHRALDNVDRAKHGCPQAACLVRSRFPGGKPKPAVIAGMETCMICEVCKGGDSQGGGAQASVAPTVDVTSSELSEIGWSADPNMRFPGASSAESLLLRAGPCPGIKVT